MAIQNHYETIWQTVGSQCPSIGGPTYELLEDFRVFAFRPSQRRNMWTYATCCMSERHDTHPLELHMFSRGESEEIVELLTAAAHYHRTGERLGVGHTINFGKPWQNNSLCDHALISLPYLDGPSLENLKIGPKLVKLYWLIPITRAEVELKKSLGLDALEQKFEDEAFDYLNPTRPSVA